MADSDRPTSGQPTAQATPGDDEDRHNVPAVSFIGPSGTGKTTLISDVITRMTAHGLRVGAIKHDAHRIELDTEGKDSWRLRETGATETLLMGANQLAWMTGDSPTPTLVEMLALLASRVDIVLVEGYRSAGLPTIIVHRPEVSDAKWERPQNCQVLASVHPSDVDPVVELLLRHHREFTSKPALGL